MFVMFASSRRHSVPKIINLSRISWVALHEDSYACVRFEKGHEVELDREETQLLLDALSNAEGLVVAEAKTTVDSL